ncbi:hypothetical protein NEMIN01_2114 [Nematocida minor]|uniref:uncharacterized protein n=1 Tax=Nematocida minor TaxID=1912983 RepID=UPI00221E65B8|nr:uncharacterized protein NEMIN01_2114 [Nematocida minor]KAI5192615.1 hypothetical protein NEMIN01_2114 [Nematocida minor]
MKNHKLEKLLNAGAILALCVIRCRGSGNAFDQEVLDRSAGLYIDGNRVASKIDGLYFSSSSFPLSISPIEKIRSLHLSNRKIDPRVQYQQGAAEMSVAGSALNQMDARRGKEPFSEEKKRKINEADRAGGRENPMDFYADDRSPLHKKQRSEEDTSMEVSIMSNSEEEEIEIIKKSGKRVAQKGREVSLSEKADETAEDQRKTIDLDISLWNEKRLYNSGRKKEKLNTKTIYRYDMSNKSMRDEVRLDSYQIQFREDIKDFFTRTAPLIQQSALCYFIASRCTTINTKYKDLLGLQEILKDNEDECAKMVKSLEGYYPGIIGDMIAYIDKYRPTRTNNLPCSVEWNENLGDIYIREDLDLNHYSPEESSQAGGIDKKYRTVACAVRMVLVLPEVYKDFLNISPEFIKNTKTSKDLARKKQNCQILLKIQELVHMHAEEKINAGVYKELYTALEDVYEKDTFPKVAVTDLYRGIYTLLARFYENAGGMDKKKEYNLVGKCIIKNQKYMKCEIKVDLGTEDTDKRVLSLGYSLEKNKWDISPKIHKHYHVLYVNNATSQLRRLCMPIYVDSAGKDRYIHTIIDIINHIKVLYEVKEEADVIHPFKMNKRSKKWTYIKEKDRNKKVEELEGHEVVFYRIDEDPAEKRFTFAKFRPLRSYKDGDIWIPLFLTPLMRRAVDLGPFIRMENEHKELSPVEVKDTVPDIYVYDYKYKEKKYSDFYKYYSNLYIQFDKEEKRSVDCYMMDLECKPTKKENSIVEAVWYTRMPSSVDEYTHCVLGKEFSKEGSSEAFDELIETVESREYNKDSELQGFRLSNSHALNSETAEQTQVIFNLLPNSSCYKVSANEEILEKIKLEMFRGKEKLREIEEEKKRIGKINIKTDTKKSIRQKRTVNSTKSKTAKRLKDLNKELYIALSKRPDSSTELMVFRNANHSKSNLGVHNEIFDIFITVYRYRKRNTG